MQSNDIDRVLGRTREGGSCARCDRDYTGAPYVADRGVRVLAEIEPGLVEPVNLCKSCGLDEEIVTDGGDGFVVPYVCPECDHDRWISTQGQPGGQSVKCPNCGHEDKMRGPGR